MRSPFVLRERERLPQRGVVRETTAEGSIERDYYRGE
jgi:hypothetical protein